MEYTNNYSSRDLTENSPLFQAGSSGTSPTTGSQGADGSLPGGLCPKGPNYSHLAILTVLCLVTYPAFYALTFLAKDKSLFVVRLIVSAWCSGIGFALGYILLKIGAQHLEAASEFIPVGYRDPLTIISNSLGRSY